MSDDCIGNCGWFVELSERRRLAGGDIIELFPLTVFINVPAVDEWLSVFG